ncbi:D-alanyl-D-alanine carboxypeptidase/D-alanyl-D-alanine-endopeptidase [bacterium]|nr:D-alanyl-D-alanine carboxypeptidase/D-alanyl-D-alanine-endopeptidase [candidate division CSSED10-310 bacterium]
MNNRLETERRLRMRLFRNLVLLLNMLLLTGITHLAAADKKIISTAADLKQDITSILQRRVCKEGKTGVFIQDLESGEILIDSNGDRPLMPASNQKIISTVGALGILSPQYLFNTSVYYSGSMDQGRISGNIFLVGGGDPFLTKEVLWKIAERVYAMGVRSVSGDIVTDGHYFDDKGYPDDDWKRITMPLWYNAPTGGIAFNFNAISVIASPGSKPGDPAKITIDPPLEYFEIQSTATTGLPKSKVTLILDIKESSEKCIIIIKGKIPVNISPQTYYRHIKSSQEYAGHSFRYLLQQVGVLVGGDVRQGKKGNEAKEIYVNNSLPLSELLRSANKFSNNFMMEQIVKAVAAESCHCSGSTRFGMQKIREFLATVVHLDTAGMVLSDGSGLSRLDRVSPRQMAHVIRWTLNESDFAPEFMTCLPIAGVDGTMKRRIAKHPNKRMIRAKTGLINNVVCLSGVVDGRRGKGLVFSIFINQNKGRHGESKKVQDDILESMLDYWVRHENNHAAFN